MDFGLRGKIAAIAGSSKGVGKAVAMGLAAEGMSVCVNGRDADTVKRTAGEIIARTGATVLGLPLDVATAALRCASGTNRGGAWWAGCPHHQHGRAACGRIARIGRRQFRGRFSA